MLTIGISTVSSSLDSLLLRIKDELDMLDERISFLICSQFSDVDSEYNFNSRVHVILRKESGISRSRNLLIEKSLDRWLWIQDDDIELDIGEVSKLLSVLEVSKSHVNCIRIRSLEDSSSFYKDYSFHSSKSMLNSLKISSIELIIDREFVVHNDLKFDTSLGLGTLLPCGEENKFFLSLINSSARIDYLEVSPCYHTTVAESRSIDYEGRFRARGYLLRSYPIYYAIPLIIRWSLFLNPEMSALDKAGLMIRNYIGT